MKSKLLTIALLSTTSIAVEASTFANLKTAGDEMFTCAVLSEMAANSPMNPNRHTWWENSEWFTKELADNYSDELPAFIKKGSQPIHIKAIATIAANNLTEHKTWSEVITLYKTVEMKNIGTTCKDYYETKTTM